MHYEAERTEAAPTSHGSASHSPSSPQAPLVLLRFSQQVRDELEQWEHQRGHHPGDLPLEPATTTKGTRRDHPAPKTPRPKRRWGRKFVGLVIFLLGVSLALSTGLMELQFRQLTQHSTQQQRQAQSLQKLQTALAAKPYDHPTLHPALRAFARRQKQLRSAHQRLCQRPASTKKASATKNARLTNAQQILQTVRHNIHRWQQWLWKQLGETYITQRRKLIAKTRAPVGQASAFCKTSPDAGLANAAAWLRRYNAKLLKQAQQHMDDYRWCRLTWSAYQAQPKHKEWLQKLRQYKCEKVCPDAPGKVPSAACTSCQRRWRKSLGLDTQGFQTYYDLVERERPRRCLTWSKKPAHGGVFHLGAYYWRVAQVLAHGQWLSARKRCDATCKGWFQRWGTRLQLRSKPGPAQIYLRLWSPQATAPTKRLARLEQYRLGLTGKATYWLPALLPKAGAAASSHKALPRDFWLLLQLYHPGSKRQTYIPYLPQAGRRDALQVTMEGPQLQLHNDGRLPVRHPTITPDGTMLAFMTYNVKAWEPQPDFTSPMCWSPGAKARQRHLPWRTAISLYPLNIKGQPSSVGQHLYTTQWLRELRLVRQTGHRHAQLLVTAPRPPSSMAAPQPLPAPTDGSAPAPEAPRAGLWQLDLAMSLRLAGSRARQMTPLPPPRYVDLPIKHDKGVLLLRRLCQPSGDATAASANALQLLQIPPTTPPQITPPSGHQVIHAAQNDRYFALLLHPKARKKGSLLALYARKPTLTAMASTPTRTLRLRLRHRQIIATRDGFLLAGAGWGQPVQQMDAKGVRSITRSDPQIRYIDPVLHPQSQRLFVVQQRQVAGAAATTKQHADFLLSWRARQEKP